MRLTVELIQNSLSYINPLKDRELDLRGAFKLYTPTWKEQVLHFYLEGWIKHRIASRIGHKIPAIENLGIAKVCASFYLRVAIRSEPRKRTWSFVDY